MTPMVVFRDDDDTFLKFSCHIVDSSATLRAMVRHNANQTITVSFNADGNGFVKIIVTADDTRNGAAQAQQLILVGPMNDAPRLDKRIPPITMMEDDAKHYLKINATFVDPDIANGDVLSFHLRDARGNYVNHVSSSIASITLLPSLQVTVDVVRFTTGGTSHFHVCAVDTAMEVVCEVFNVTVHSTPDDLRLITKFPVVQVPEDSTPVLLDLHNYFIDDDHPQQALRFGASSFDTTICTVAINTSALTLRFPTDAYGSGAVTVIATNPEGHMLAASFRVKLEAKPDAPQTHNIDLQLDNFQSTRGSLMIKDIDGDSLSVILTEEAKCGTVTITYPQSTVVTEAIILYTPKWSQMETCRDATSTKDTFKYKVCSRVPMPVHECQVFVLTLPVCLSVCLSVCVCLSVSARKEDRQMERPSKHRTRGQCAN